MVSSSSVFIHSGLLYAEKNFWSAEECLQLREISKFSPSEDAGIYAEGKQTVDSPFRKTKRILISYSIQEELHKSIFAAKPSLENHYGLALSGLQTCQLLKYDTGGYFRAHQDEKELPSEFTRKLSVVIFLNSARKTKSSFTGGQIVFYEDMPQYLAGNGFPFEPEQGLLLVFPSYLLHEVCEVTTGIRYSVVSWFY
jgi:SM-20-related protein